MPPVVPVGDGRDRLSEAKFIRLHITKRYELWQNRYGKCVTVDFS